MCFVRLLSKNMGFRTPGPCRALGRVQRDTATLGLAEGLHRVLHGKATCLPFSCSGGSRIQIKQAACCHSSGTPDVATSSTMKTALAFTGTDRSDPQTHINLRQVGPGSARPPHCGYPESRRRPQGHWVRAPSRRILEPGLCHPSIHVLGKAWLLMAWEPLLRFCFLSSSSLHQDLLFGGKRAEAVSIQENRRQPQRTHQPSFHVSRQPCHPASRPAPRKPARTGWGVGVLPVSAGVPVWGAYCQVCWVTSNPDNPGGSVACHQPLLGSRRYF